MPKNRFLGVVLLACGVYLMWMGRQSLDVDAGSWTTQVMTGTISDQSLLYWTAGVIMAIAGIMMAKRH